MRRLPSHLAEHTDLAARLFGEDPGRQIREDLRDFKQIMEAGDVLTNTGQTAVGSSTSDGPGLVTHPG